MIQIPKNPMIKPEIALLGGAVLSPSIPIMTIQRGKIAPMIEPRPAEIYFTPQVLKPLLKTKLRTESTRSGNRSFFSGRGYFLMIKYNKYKLPPRNCLIPESLLFFILELFRQTLV